MLMLSLTQIVH